jgi:hypothetical protein
MYNNREYLLLNIVTCCGFSLSYLQRGIQVYVCKYEVKIIILVYVNCMTLVPTAALRTLNFLKHR